MATLNGSLLRNPNGVPRILGADGQPINPLAGPEAQYAVPHVIQFSALFSSAWKTYIHGQHDEALRRSREDAVAMRNDLQVMGLLQERKLATGSLKWHIEVDNEKDPRQKFLKDGLTQIIKAIPAFHRLRYYLLEALWYGRYGAQVTWQFKPMDIVTETGAQRRRVLTVKQHEPVDGDSIGYHWDGTPYLLIYAPVAEDLVTRGSVSLLSDEDWNKQRLPDSNTGLLAPKSFKPKAEVGFSTIGGRALFLKGSWRLRFLLHKHEVATADFFHPEQAGAIHGVGIRSFIYWTWWLKTEWLGMISDWIQRTGLGVRLWYYQGGSKASKAAVEQAARDQSDKVNILVPRFGETPNEGIDFVETSGSGASMLLELLQHLESLIERFVIGQSMSSGADDEDGLGGTGRAMFAKDTKARLIGYDAMNEDETLTADLVEPIKRWTFPELAEMPARFVTDIDMPDMKERLESAKTIVDMGGTVKEDEVRSAAGFTAPKEGDAVLGGQQPGMGLPGMGEKPGGDDPELAQLVNKIKQQRGDHAGPGEAGGDRPAHRLGDGNPPAAAVGSVRGVRREGV